MGILQDIVSKKKQKIQNAKSCRSVRELKATITDIGHGNESTFYVVPPASINRLDQDMRNYDRTINMNGLWDKD